MTHLDEGQLNAYLDGEGTEADGGGRSGVEAHLAECAACRARLEEERRVRDRARAILGAAGPASLTAPPFDLVVQRAARQREMRPSIRPLVAMAWAASLALAITVGWYARGLVVGSGETGAAAGAPSAEGPRAGAIQAAPPAAKQVAQRLPSRGEPPPPLREAARPDTAAATTGLPDRPLAHLAQAEAKAERDTEAAPLRVAEAPVPSPAAPAEVMRPSRIETRAAAKDVVEGAWLTVPLAEAERRLGGPLASIPGLPSLGTSVYGTGPSTVARTIQVLGPGLTIELVQQRAAAPAVERAARERFAAPAAMPSAGRAAGEKPGRSLTVEWEGFSVTGRALVPADSLQKLLGRLRRP